MPTQSKAGKMRDSVAVMRPTEAQGPRGQSQGSPETIINEWPCSIRPLGGREIVQARTVFAEATHEIEGYGIPAKTIKEKDFLTGGTIGARTIHISSIKREHSSGAGLLTLLCGERTGG